MYNLSDYILSVIFINYCNNCFVNVTFIFYGTFALIQQFLLLMGLPFFSITVFTYTRFFCVLYIQKTRNINSCKNDKQYYFIYWLNYLT